MLFLQVLNTFDDDVCVGGVCVWFAVWLPQKSYLVKIVFHDFILFSNRWKFSKNVLHLSTIR